MIPAWVMGVVGGLYLITGAELFGITAWGLIFHREAVSRNIGVRLYASIMLLGFLGYMGVGVLFLLAARWLWLGQWRRAGLACLLAVIFGVGVIAVSLYLDIVPCGVGNGDPGSL